MLPRTAYLRSALVLFDTSAISVLYTIATGGQASLHTAEVAFIGPLLGSAARIARGEFSDRLGADRITLGAFAAAIVAGGFLVADSAHGDLTYRTGSLIAAVTTIGYIVETPAFLAFLASYIGAAVLTWARYLRPHYRAQPPG